MPSATSVGPKVAIEVDGSKLPDDVQDQLIELLVDHRRNAPDLFRIVLHDPELKLVDSTTFTIGRDVKISVEMDQQAQGVLTIGHITSVTLEDDAWGTQLIVQGMDRSHGLFRNRKVVAHVNVKYSDVVSKIATAAGLSATVTATTVVHDHLSQNGLTDWEFLQMMAQDVGYDVWVDAGALHFEKPATASSAAAVKLERGKNLVHLTVVTTGGGQASKEIQVRGWDPATARPVSGQAAAGSTVGVAAGMGDAAKVRGTSFNNGTTTVTRTPFRQQAEADAVAKATAEAVASSSVELTGAAGGDPRLKVRAVVEIAGAGTRFSGKYVLTEARHIWDAEAGYRTEFTVTGRHDHSLLALAGGSGGATSPSRMNGVVIGVVSNVRDPDGLGRIKIKLPWLDETYESDWARLVQLIAGKEYGSLFVPEVDDEVLVGFEHGDINRPYVLGSLYNGVHKPDKAVKKLVGSDGVASQRIETRTRNRLVFYDGSGKQGVTLRTGDDKYFIDLNRTATKITVSSDGDITIEAKKGKVLLDAKDVELKAAGSATFKSTGKFTIEATAGLELKSAGVVEVKGSIVKLN